MTLFELVPSLALCQQLKAAGFPQDTALVWGRAPQGWINGGGVYADKEGIVHSIPFTPTGGYADEVMLKSAVNTLHTVLCAAPTAEEILKELPPDLQGSCCPLGLDVLRFAGCNFDGTPAPLKWIVQWCCPEIDEVVGRNESEASLALAAAQAYLWWKAPPKEREP